MKKAESNMKTKGNGNITFAKWEYCQMRVLHYGIQHYWCLPEFPTEQLKVPLSALRMKKLAKNLVLPHLSILRWHKQTDTWFNLAKNCKTQTFLNCQNFHQILNLNNYKITKTKCQLAYCEKAVLKLFEKVVYLLPKICTLQLYSFMQY